MKAEEESWLPGLGPKTQEDLEKQVLEKHKKGIPLDEKEREILLEIRARNTKEDREEAGENHY